MNLLSVHIIWQRLKTSVVRFFESIKNHHEFWVFKIYIFQTQRSSGLGYISKTLKEPMVLLEVIWFFFFQKLENSDYSWTFSLVKIRKCSMKSPLEMNLHFNILPNVGANENYITTKLSFGSPYHLVTYFVRRSSYNREIR